MGFRNTFENNQQQSHINNSRVAQRKRAGPITQRSVDRNYALLTSMFLWLAHVFSYDEHHTKILMTS
jgi:hypothetical protein